MKKINRLFALMLAVVMMISLAACAKLTPPQNAAPTDAAVQSPTRTDDSVQPTESKDAKAATQAKAQDGEQKSDKTLLHLDQASFQYVNPFSEGLAWVIHKNKIKVISKEGEIVFETDSSSFETTIPMPFLDGVSCYNVDRDYFIIDKEGKTLYQTEPYDENNYEEILGYGDGRFLVHRFSKGFKNGSKTGGHTLGTIDKNGKETTEFYSVDFTPEKEWEYLCDGVFYEPLSMKVFDSENGECSSIGNDVSGIGNETDSVLSVPHEITAENGKVWVELSSLHGLGIMDVHTLEIQKFDCKDNNHTYIIDNIGVVDGVYYDLNGEKIAAIDAYMPNVIRRGKFSESGCTPLVLNDGSSYITYVDKNGKDRFDPMKLGPESSFTEEYFANSEDKDVVIYDTTGKECYRVRASDHKDLKLYDDYFIAGKNYYFFK